MVEFCVPQVVTASKGGQNKEWAGVWCKTIISESKKTQRQGNVGRGSWVQTPTVSVAITTALIIASVVGAASVASVNVLAYSTLWTAFWTHGRT